MKQGIKSLAVWAALIIIFAAAFMYWGNGGKTELTYVEFEQFQNWLTQGLVERVRFEEDRISFALTDGRSYIAMNLFTEESYALLDEKGVEIQWRNPVNWTRLILTYGIPVLIVLAVLVWFLKRLGGGTANVLALKNTTARRVSDKSVKFDNVGGCAEAKLLLQDVVSFLKNPKPWKDGGVRLPRGILLEGPTGCGKTLLARAVAGETNAAFFELSASEFVEMFVGVGAARVRDLFEKAAKSLPAIIFIDELDAVGRRRGSGIGSGHDEREQTLNQLLVCLDGFCNSDRLVVIAATNRPDILDKALMRPGRFDRSIRVPNLSSADRLEILKIHTTPKPVSADIDWMKLVNMTDGFNGAALENLTNEAAILAVRRSQQNNGTPPLITTADFETVLAAKAADKGVFTALDALLIESVSQLAEPVGTINTRVQFEPNHVLEGKIIWADAAHIKILDQVSNQTYLLPKIKILNIEAMAGTSYINKHDLAPNGWQKMPEMAD